VPIGTLSTSLDGAFVERSNIALNGAPQHLEVHDDTAWLTFRSPNGESDAAAIRWTSSTITAQAPLAQPRESGLLSPPVDTSAVVALSGSGFGFAATGMVPAMTGTVEGLAAWLPDGDALDLAQPVVVALTEPGSVGAAVVGEGIITVLTSAGVIGSAPRIVWGRATRDGYWEELAVSVLDAVSVVGPTLAKLDDAVIAAWIEIGRLDTRLHLSIRDLDGKPFSARPDIVQSIAGRPRPARGISLTTGGLTHSIHVAWVSDDTEQSADHVYYATLVCEDD
jgi:hypothetical protein